MEKWKNEEKMEKREKNRQTDRQTDARNVQTETRCWCKRHTEKRRVKRVCTLQTMSCRGDRRVGDGVRIGAGMVIAYIELASHTNVEARKR